ncbi:hypothetical protein C8R43DRAFT_1136891 [Mycena crocata]|nr:hypothetical protein C8R43DRAFT_1136891 [Mycena crocata]
MPCDLPFYPNKGNFVNPTEHDENRRKHWYLVLDAPGLFTYRRDAEAYAAAPGDVIECFTKALAFQAWGENCEDEHHHNGEIVPDSEEESTANTNDEDVGPAPSRPSTRSTSAASKPAAKRESSLIKLRSESVKLKRESVKLETPTGRRKFKHEQASVKLETPLPQRDRSPLRPLFQDDESDHAMSDNGMNVDVDPPVTNDADLPATRLQRERVSVAASTEREGRTSHKRPANPTTPTAGSTKRVRERRRTSPTPLGHPRRPSIPASPPPASTISPSVSSASSMLLSTATESSARVAPGSQPRVTLLRPTTRGAAAAAATAPAAMRAASGAPARMRPALGSATAAFRGRSAVASQASAPPATPPGRTVRSQTSASAAPPSHPAHSASVPTADPYTHFGPAAFERYLAQRVGAESVSGRRSASTRGDASASSSGAGSSGAASATSPPAGLLYNNSTHKLYNNVRLAMREMRSTETVQVVDYDEVVAFFSGEGEEEEQDEE